MKILILHSVNFFSEAGAAPNRWKALMKGLANFDVEIMIVFLSGYKSLKEKITYGEHGIINDRIRYKYCSRQNNYNIWLRRTNLYFMSDLYGMLNYFKLKRILYEFKPDIIFISPTLEVFKAAYKLVSRDHIKCKLMTEFTEFNDAMEAHTTNAFQRHLLRIYTHNLLKIFPYLDLCLVITDTLKEHYSRFPGMNPNIAFLKVPITVDFSRFEIFNTEKWLPEPYIAYAGSSSFIKDGVDTLVKAFVKISADYPELKLVIAAFWENDGPKMIDLINSTVVKDRILYLGELSSEEIPALIIRAKVLALPRPDSRQARGGFPTKLGEYLASGNPVCVTRVSEITDYLTDGESAFLADPGDVDSFADALSRALLDDTRSRRIGANGKKVALDNFNIDVQAERIYDFISDNI